jgi:hypothetical protein
MRWRCTLGCKDSMGRDKVHPSKRLCPIYSGMKTEDRLRIQDAERAAKVEAQQVAAPVLDEQSKPPGVQPPGPNRRPPPSWGVSFKPATSTDPGALNAPKPSPIEWEITAETSERFWQNIFAIIEMIVDFVCRAFQIPEVPAAVFQLDEGQKFVFRTALRPPTSKFLQKAMGAKSPEQADMIVSGMSGLIGFGQVFAKIGVHFWKYVPESPRWKSMKERFGRGIRRRGARETEAEVEDQTERPARRAVADTEVRTVEPPAIPAGAMA